MKEIEVGILTNEEKKILRNLLRAEEVIRDKIAKYHSAQMAFWALMRSNHNLGNGAHYIRKGVIYEQSLK